MTRKQALKKALAARKGKKDSKEKPRVIKVAMKPRKDKGTASGYGYTETLYKPQAPRPRPRLPYHDNPPAFGEPNMGGKGGNSPRIRITIQTD